MSNIDQDEEYTVLKRQDLDGHYTVYLEHLPKLRQRFLEDKRFLGDHARRLGL